MTTTKPTLANLRRIASRLGCEVEVCPGDEFEVTIEAPSGHRFKMNDVHEIVVSEWDAEGRAAVYASAIDRLTGESIEECRNPECEWCYEERGFQMGETDARTALANGPAAVERFLDDETKAGAR